MLAISEKAIAARAQKDSIREDQAKRILADEKYMAASNARGQRMPIWMR